MRQVDAHHGQVFGLAFSPDGKLLAAGYDELVLLWDVATGKERATLSGHRGAVQAVSFSPDGKRLLSQSEDGTALVWQVFDPAPVPRATDLNALWADLAKDGITAHRAVFADGTVAGMTVLVQGVLGGVGALAAQLAHWGGATVIGTVLRDSDLSRVDSSAVAHLVALDRPYPADAIRAHAPDGVDRIVEVAFSDNADLDGAVAANNAVIAREYADCRHACA